MTELNTLLDICNAINTMEEYLELKVNLKDWRGVRDAAAELETLNVLYKQFLKHFP